MPADRLSPARLLRTFLSVLVLIALAAFATGCGGDDAQTTSTSLEKPALTVPEGSVTAKSSSRGSTSSTGSTGTATDDSSADSGTDTSAGEDTGGADTGTDTDGGAGTGTDTGAEDTGGAGLGN